MSVYHQGELAVQHRLGQNDIAARLGRMVGDTVPDVAADFLAAQPMIVLAAADDTGRMWVSQLTGEPGFVHVLGDHQIAVNAIPAVGDPLHDSLSGGPNKVGMIAIQPQTRRRMRINGHSAPTSAGLLIDPDQVYSNCPKYISRRNITGGGESGTPTRHRTGALDAHAEQIIAAADTFFVGSADTEGNADASHRGGNPGFLQVLSPTRVRWPDYRGNSMFMTLGNISVNPRAALLIYDWTSGDTLQLTGTAQIIWAGTPGAQCAVEFEITEVIASTGGSPLRWSEPELSPANPR